MKDIKLYFTDFYQGFVFEESYIYKSINRSFNVIIDREKPDFLIYSCFGHDFLNYDCVKIFYTTENVVPDFNLCDYATGFAHLQFGDRYRRFPNFAAYRGEVNHLIKLNENIVRTKVDLVRKKYFCNFIYSNAKADPSRDYFFHLLANYKHVDSLGKHLNNKNALNNGNWNIDKVEMMKNYKFSIAFENSSLPGYTTEKLMHSFIAGTIPIYWGDPLVSNEFNSKSFINCHEFDNFDSVIERIKQIDCDDNLYLEILNQKIFKNKPPEYLNDDYLLNFYSNIFSKQPNDCIQRTKYGYVGYYESFTFHDRRNEKKNSIASFFSKLLNR